MTPAHQVWQYYEIGRILHAETELSPNQLRQENHGTQSKLHRGPMTCRGKTSLAYIR